MQQQRKGEQSLIAGASAEWRPNEAGERREGSMRVTCAADPSTHALAPHCVRSDARDAHDATTAANAINFKPRELQIFSRFSVLNNTLVYPALTDTHLNTRWRPTEKSRFSLLITNKGRYI